MKATGHTKTVINLIDHKNEEQSKRQEMNKTSEP